MCAGVSVYGTYGRWWSAARRRLAASLLWVLLRKLLPPPARAYLFPKPHTDVARFALLLPPPSFPRPARPLPFPFNMDPNLTPPP